MHPSPGSWVGRGGQSEELPGEVMGEWEQQPELGRQWERKEKRLGGETNPSHVLKAWAVGWQRCWLEGCSCRSEKAPNESGGRMMREHPQAKCCLQSCQTPTGCLGLTHGVLGCPLQPLGLCQHRSDTNKFL